MLRVTTAFMGIALVIASSSVYANGTPGRTWPQIDVYKRAVRANGSAIFLDPKLRSAQVRRTATGHPITIKGNYSVVFRVDGNGQSWAARCFLKEPDRERLQAISQWIRAPGRPEKSQVFSDYDFQHEGVEIDGARYPLITMPWLNEPTLDQRMDQLVQDDTAPLALMTELAERWRRTVAAVRAEGVGHLDYQHGNIKVPNSGLLHLIDYDGLFLEAFRGKPSGEGGHPHYQHPDRTNRHFYVDVDNFSALAVYTSLLALEADHSIWNDAKFHIADGLGGGDNLIFQASDFMDPDASPIFARLKQSPSAKVRELAAQLASLSLGPISDVPPLETILTGAPWQPDGDTVEPEPPQAAPNEPSMLETPQTPAATSTNDHEVRVPNALNGPAQHLAHFRKQLLGHIR